MGFGGILGAGLRNWRIMRNFAVGFRNRWRDDEVRVMLRTNVKS